MQQTCLRGTGNMIALVDAGKSNSTAKTQQDVPILLMFGKYPSGDQYFTGELDDIRIYNKNLNRDDINILFSEGK